MVRTAKPLRDLNAGRFVIRTTDGQDIALQLMVFNRSAQGCDERFLAVSVLSIE